jgi:transposase
MRPPQWQPPVEPSPAERTVLTRIRRAKLFIFLRQIRHELFSDAFQAELAQLYADAPRGQPPVPPAQLALATILQAYTGASDDEVIEACVMDRRWQVVLDCLDAAHAPFGKATLVRFRTALIGAELDRRLIERTVELAQTRGGFGPRQLRLALDSSPLWGAGRVEDTINLVGHAMRKLLGVVARQQGRELTDLCAEVGVTWLGGSSLKAALDLDWDVPAQRTQALGTVLAALTALEAWLPRDPAVQTVPAVADSLAAAAQVRAQDVVLDETGSPTLRQGVAKDRRISVEDAQMRHGRKSRSQRVDGYKRHIARDLDRALVRAVGVTPANVPEAAVAEAILADLSQQGVAVACSLPAVRRPAEEASGTPSERLAELAIDRAYLSSSLVRDRSPDWQIVCKAWPVRNGSRFTKQAFTLDWERQEIHCPNAVVVPFRPGAVVHFPAEVCERCPLQARCTTSPRGRSVAIHPDEPLLAELRRRQQTAVGRAKLRERVGVEHSLAHIGRWQGDRARYIGQR